MDHYLIDGESGMDGDRRYTLAEAAEQLGVSVTRARGIRQEVGVGAPFGRAWMLSDADIEVMRRRNTRTGPKPAAAEDRDEG